MTSVRHKDLQDSTKTAVLVAIIPLIVLALLAAGSLAVWKVCGNKLKAKAAAWSWERKKRQQPYNLYVRRRFWEDPSPNPEIMKDATGEQAGGPHPLNPNAGPMAPPPSPTAVEDEAPPLAESTRKIRACIVPTGRRTTRASGRNPAATDAREATAFRLLFNISSCNKQ